MPSLALSTSWNAHRHSDGYAMLREAAELGFSAVELSHGTRVPLVPGILKAKTEGWMAFSSIHAFCPLPPGADGPSPNLFEPTAPDAGERAAWKRHLERTIDFAIRLEAPVVVMHLGSYRFRWFETDPTKTWPTPDAWDKLKEEAAATAWAKARAAGLEKLKAKRDRFWVPLVDGLKSISDTAAKAGVRLGLENREGNTELPLDGDWPELFSTLGEGPWGYWHDTGHAHLKAKLGLLDLEKHLASLSSQLLGFHCHGVSPEGRDHQGLTAGGVDWDVTRRFWRRHHRFTLELSPRVSREDVLASKEMITPWLADLPV